MMPDFKQFIYSLTALIVFAPSSGSANEIDSLIAAFEVAEKVCRYQDDKVVADALMERARSFAPEYAQDISQYVNHGCKAEDAIVFISAATVKQQEEKPEVADITPPTVQAQIKAAKTSKHAEKIEKESRGLSWGLIESIQGEVEGGGNWQTGNTDQRSLLLGSKALVKSGSFRNSLTANARHITSNDIAIEEEYRADLRSDYKLSDTLFTYGDLGYVSDRFSGFSSRTSQVLGLGRVLHDDKELYLEMRGGAGARQDRLVTGERIDSPVANIQTEGTWRFREGWELGQTGAASYTNENQIYESQTALKSKITDEIALKAAYEHQYIDGAPVGNNPNNTRTTFSVIYGF